MRYQEKKGDLFSCDADVSLAHCISEDCRMGKGIAVAFRDKFGGVAELKQQVAGGKTTGTAAVLRRGDRFVYYLMTKRVYSDKPTYESLGASLRDMRGHCVRDGVRRLAMPRIGCGLDGLQWDRVADLIRETFADSDIEITVYTR